MNFDLPPILLPSLRLFFSHRLQNLIYLQATHLLSFNQDVLIFSSQEKLLSRTRLEQTSFPLSYTSTIALPLAAILTIPPEQVAKALVIGLPTTTEQTIEDNALQSPYWNSMHRVWKHSNVSATSDGWLQWRLAPQGLAVWLQTLTELPLSCSVCFQAIDGLGNDNQFLTGTRVNFFCVYHTYARCYSLLHQAQQDGLIRFTSAKGAVDEIISQFSLPWLDSNGNLYFVNWAEHELIKQLAIGLDQLAIAYATNYLEPSKLAQAAIALSQSFQHFHAHCRIWGMQERSQIAQARLGLVLATVHVLRLLVQDGLGISLVKAL